MTLYEKNILSIKKNCSYIDFANPCKGSFSLIPEKSKSGPVTAVGLDAVNGKRIFLHSRYDPIKEADAFVDGILGKAGDSCEECHSSTVLVFGIGFGYHLRALLKRLSGRGRVIAVEPDTAFFERIIQYSDLTDILCDERFYFMLGKSPGELRGMLVDYFDLFNAHSMTEGCLPSYKTLFEQEYRDFYAALEAVKQKIEMLTYISYERGPLSVENFARNIPELKACVDFRHLKGKLKDIPCVIVAAGPSLDKNIDRLHYIKGRAFVICVYTALAPLLRSGIEPDAVISMDAKQLVRESQEARQERYDIPLIHVATSPNELLQKFIGIKILCLTEMDGYLTDTLQRLNRHETGEPAVLVKLGGSVVCSALDFAVICGCSPIIFVGLDLAFADDEKTHATGTSYDYTDKNFLARLQMLTVPGINGEPVVSADNMTIYRKWIEKYIALDKSGRTYIDATEGGALIEGTRVETLDNTIRKYIENNSVLSELSKILGLKGMFAGNEYKYFLEDIEKTLDAYEGFLSELEQRISLAQKLCGCGNDLACRDMAYRIDDFIAKKNFELRMFTFLVNYAYIYADKNYEDKAHSFYMNSFAFKLSFYKLLSEILSGFILTFRACIPIKEERE